MNSILKRFDPFISAIQFITILNFSKTAGYHPLKMIPYFPVTGLLIGIMTCALDSVIFHFWSAPVTAIVILVFLILITGGFHVDGLADTADGLFSHRPKEKILHIMKDSRVGSMGLLVVISVLALKWGGIYSLPHETLSLKRALILILVPAYARSSMLFAFKSLPYCRKQGTGADFFKSPLPNTAFLSMIPLVLLSLGLGLKGILLNICFILITQGCILYYRRQMGCVTGDMLGAMTEITEALLFLSVSIKGGAWIFI